MVESLITMSIVGLISGFIFSMPVAGPISILITSNALKGRIRYCNKVAIGASFADFLYVFLSVYGVTRLYPWFKPAMPYILAVGAVFIFYVGYRLFGSKVNIEPGKPGYQPQDGKPIKQGKGGLYTGFMVNFLNPTLFFGSLTSSVLVISFIASLGFNTGGLDAMVGENLRTLNSMDGRVAQDSAVTGYFKPDTLSFFKHQRPEKPEVRPTWFPVAISLSYAGALAVGSILWFVLMALVISRFRHRINVRIINGIIRILGIALCLFGLFFAYTAARMLFPEKKSSPEVAAYWSHPAAKWQEAIPIGNGTLGGMVYGGTGSDTLKLNEATLWSGEPADKQNLTAAKYLPAIRQLLMEDRTAEAQRLIDSTMLGPYNECYLPMGDLVLDWDQADSVRDYRRELNLTKGLVTIASLSGKSVVTRELFASHPDQLIAIRIAGSVSGAVSFKAHLTSLLKHSVVVNQGEMRLDGQAPKHAYPHYLGKMDPVYEEGHGMKFQVRMQIRARGGRVEVSDGKLIVSGADEAEILLTGATSFNGFDKDPYTEGKDCNAICAERLAKAAALPYDQLRERHISDFSGLFNRVSLDLGSSPADSLPVDVRIRNYQPGADPGLTALYYQFGRYLLISSSRTGGQPANLQGIWSDNLQPAWSANWTLNCNAQINYWPVEQANLGECHLPLIDMTRELSVDGALTARNMYQSGGWVAHHNADIWRQTSPVGGNGLWAIYQVGGAWLCHHVWEHYEFSLDKEYLKEVYPLLRGAAQFYLDNLQLDRDGFWVTSPAESFENQFRKPDGTIGWACMGPTQDMQIIRDLFTNCMQAAKILETDENFSRAVAEKLDKLLPMRISPTTGRLQEWKDDWEAADPRNGQVAQGWGLAVGNQISPRETPELAAAFRKTIEFRKPWESYNAGSWVGSFPARYWVRLYDGEMAQTVFDRHFHLAVFPNLTSKFFDTFWEIDGNLGITAAIGEMLLQSHTGELVLLPALPSKYPDGEVKGLRARGAFTVDLKWRGGKLEKATVHADKSGTCRVRYGEQTWVFEMRAGQSRTF